MHTRRANVRTIELIVAPVKGGALFSQQTVNDLHRFTIHPPPIADRWQLDTKPTMFAIGVSTTKPQLQTSVGDMVDRHRLLREQTRMAKRITAHQHANTNTLGMGRERRQNSPPFEVRPGLIAGLVEVITIPDTVEAERLKKLPALHQRIEAQILIGANPKFQAIVIVIHWYGSPGDKRLNASTSERRWLFSRARRIGREMAKLTTSGVS